MELHGDVYSTECGLAYNVTTTAIRIDWETAAGKAVNYSVWQTLSCLVQIVLLLRQLHHTQSASAASRVSVLCIGMQAIVDSLSTIFHISLSVFIQSLFTAFLSIVFFKVSYRTIERPSSERSVRANASRSLVPSSSSSPS